MKYGLIGNPLGHSYSPEIHKRLRGYAYELWPMPPEQLPEFFARRDFEGINVTIPYKKAVIPYCDSLSETARRAGSVNTIVKHGDGSLHGDNTDLQGFQFMLARAGISLAGMHVVILGSGGSSLTARLAARDAGARSVTVVSRAGEVNYENVYERCQNAQVLVNTTPVGMFPKPAARPIDLARFPAARAAVDLIYNPLRTRFLQQAQALGLKATGGLSMLVAQAAASAALFAGAAQSASEVERVLAQLQSALQNWVLIGMPGCGKSTVGAYLAERSGRGFVDLDNEIEARAGIPCGEIISRRGEAAFRDLESEAAAELGMKTGLVIAAGGGTVLREENTANLRQNGRLLWVQRDAARLDTRGRPLSVNLEQLAQARAPFYAGAADAIVIHNENWEALKENIWEAFQDETA